jgi:hypothetical protein
MAVAACIKCNPEIRGDIIALWLTGYTYREIEYGLDVSKGTVQTVLRTMAAEFPEVRELQERWKENVRAS